MRKLVACLVALLATATANAGLITVSNNTPGNFDASSGNRGMTITPLTPGYDTGIITGLTISINFAKADGQAFDPPFPGGTPFHNEIHFRLEGPGGQNVTLIAPGSFNPGSTLFDGTITFDQNALQLVNVNPNLPQAGTFRPTGAGSLFDYLGLLAAGNWNLFIQDTVGLDSLRFRSVTLNITTEATTPEPISMIVFGGLVLGGAGVALRRRMTAKATA